MNKSRLISLCLFCLMTASAGAQAKKKVVVLPLDTNKAYTQQGQDDTEGIYAALRSAITDKGVLTVINRGDTDKILGEKEFQTKSVTEKVRDTLRLANADYLIMGRLDEIGNTYNLTVDLYNLAAETIATAFESNIQKNSASSFNQAAQRISEKFFSPPRPNGGITVSRSGKEIQLKWTRASDTSLFEKLLEYKVVYSTDSEDLQDPFFSERDGTNGLDWTQGARRASFSVPSETGTYYFTVLVRNPLGSVAMYEVKSASGQTVRGGGGAGTAIAGMVYVEGGTFQMGSTTGENDEKPVHGVTVGSFYIGKYEVTQEEYRAVMGANPSNFKGERRPVECVSWYAAVEYCNRRSLAERLTPCYRGSGDNITCDWSADGYRLPTEAEWEYAATGGNKAYLIGLYSGGSDIGGVAWYDGNSGGQTHDVGTKSPNALGIYDMSGNVWEWCWDWYDSGYYGRSAAQNPSGPASGSNRVLRGGSWSNFASYCRCAIRNYYSPGDSNSTCLGFRVVRSGR